MASSALDNHYHRSLVQMHAQLPESVDRHDTLLQERTDTTARMMPISAALLESVSSAPYQAVKIQMHIQQAEQTEGVRTLADRGSADCSLHAPNIGQIGIQESQQEQKSPMACSPRYPLRSQHEDLDVCGPRPAKIGGVPYTRPV